MDPKSLYERALMGEIERRTFRAEDVRAIASDNPDEPKRIGGHYIVFNQWAQISGWFREMVKDFACDRSIAEDEILSCFNHNPDYVLGNNRANPPTLTITKDGVGIYAEALPPDTDWARGLVQNVERGDVHGGSFWFSVDKDLWGTENGMDFREIHQVTIYELGPGAFPAYPQTDAGVRELLPGVDPQLLERALLRARSGQARQLDFDVIEQCATVLRKQIPTDPQGREGAPDDQAQGGSAMWRLGLLRKRIDLLDL